MAMLCLNFWALAQQTNLTELPTGKKVPDSFWTIQHAMYRSGKISKETLNQYKGKLLILDFWATWCSSCISKIPLMDSLNREFGNKLAIVLASVDPPEKTDGFFKKRRGSEPYDKGFVSIVNDQTLPKLFPHRIIPHYVWILPDGRVYATSSFRNVTRSKIDSLLNNKVISFEQKIDQDPERPLYISTKLDLEKLLDYSILIKGHVEGTGEGTTTRQKFGKTNAVAVYNSTMSGLFSRSFAGIDKRFTVKKMVVEVSDMEMFFNKPTEPGKPLSRPKEYYSYDLVVPVDSAARLYHIMLENLNRITPYMGKVEYVMQDCWVMKKQDSTTLPNGPIDMTNWSSVYLSDLINTLATTYPDELPVINETGIIKLDYSSVKLSADMSDVAKQLIPLGIKMSKQKRAIPKFSVSQKTTR